MPSSPWNDTLLVDRRLVHCGDRFQLNLWLFMQLCKNELQFILAHVIHQKDNVFPDGLQHLPCIPAVRYQLSQNLKTIMALFGLLSLYYMWRHANQRERGWTLDTRFGLQVQSLENNPCCTKEGSASFWALWLSILHLIQWRHFLGETFLILLIELESRNLFKVFHTSVF